MKWKTAKRRTAITAFSSMAIVALAPGAALAAGGGSSPAVECDGLTYVEKYNWNGSEFVADQGGDVVTLGNVTSQNEGTWESTTGISRVVFKGGHGDDRQDFDPPRDSGSYSNSGLPEVGNGNTPAISHITFCADDSTDASTDDPTDDSTEEDSTEDDSTEDSTKEDSTEDDSADDSTEDSTEEDSTEDDSADDSTEDSTGDDSTEDDSADDSTEDSTEEDSTEDDSADDSTEDSTGDDSTGDDSTEDDSADDSTDDSADDSTEDDSTEDDSADDSTEDSTEDDSTGDDSTEDSTEDSTGDGSTEDGSTEDSTDDSTDEATEDDDVLGVTISDETDTADVEEDGDVAVLGATQERDDTLPRTGGDATQLLAIGLLTLLLGFGLLLHGRRNGVLAERVALTAPAGSVSTPTTVWTASHRPRVGLGDARPGGVTRGWRDDLSPPHLGN